MEDVNKQQRQRRRRILRYYAISSGARKKAIHDAAPNLTEFDQKRINQCLRNNLNAYTGIEDRKVFQQWAVEWVTRIANLTELAKPMLPALAKTAYTVPGIFGDDCYKVATLVLQHLHLYEGDETDVDNFASWAASWIIQEAAYVIELYAWMREHQSAVYGGLLSILKDCPNLSADSDLMSIAEDLAQEVWAWASLHMAALVKPGTAAIPWRLRARAVWTARAWKTSRVRSPRIVPPRRDDEKPAKSGEEDGLAA